MENYIVLENIRSCYNVGNMIRTADALWRHVILTWYTPSPRTQPKVKKTSLWAEESVTIHEFATTMEAIHFLKKETYTVIAAEVTDTAIALDIYQQKKPPLVAIVVGNEVTWVEPDTLSVVDCVVKVPMIWKKESLNVGQTAAIFMRALQ